MGSSSPRLLLHAALAPAGAVHFGLASMKLVPADRVRHPRADRLLAAYFVVPMNALLQHRGHVAAVRPAHRSRACRNFNENLISLAMLGIYALLVWLACRSAR